MKTEIPYITKTCDICKKIRQSKSISTRLKGSSTRNFIRYGYFEDTINYCNDNRECTDKSLIYERIDQDVNYSMDTSDSLSCCTICDNMLGRSWWGLLGR